MNAILVFLLALIPQTIHVRVTGLEHCNLDTTYRIQIIDFREYTKSVLPNEWYPKWEEESLKAGALAVKMFAWSMYETKGYVWDCTRPQVYNPAKRTDATDKAVDDTWYYVLLKSQDVTGIVTNRDLTKIVRTLYNADEYGCLGRGENCMSQWGSQSDAVNGMTWREIISKYYGGELILISEAIQQCFPYRVY